MCPAPLPVGLLGQCLGRRAGIDLQSLQVVLDAEVAVTAIPGALRHADGQGLIVDQTHTPEALNRLLCRRAVETERLQPCEQLGLRSRAAGDQPQHPLLSRVDLRMPAEQGAGAVLDPGAHRQPKFQHPALVHPAAVSVRGTDVDHRRMRSSAPECCDLHG